jgi:hypothetical protein
MSAKWVKWTISGVAIAVLTAWAGFARVAQAEIAGPAIQTQGTLVAVSVDALTFSVAGPAVQQFYVTPMTAIYAGNEQIAFNRMPEFIGVATLVWSAPIESEQIAGIVTLLVYPASGVIPPGVNPGNPDLGGGPAIGGGGGGGGGHGHGEGGNSGKGDYNEHGQGGGGSPDNGNHGNNGHDK